MSRYVAVQSFAARGSGSESIRAAMRRTKPGSASRVTLANGASGTRLTPAVK